MKKLLLVSAIAASTLMASGYKIPEQSLNSTALAGAYVSNTSAADASYYNPANMAFMGEGKSIELNLMYAHLNPVQFDGQIVDISNPQSHDPSTPPVIKASTSESSSENFLIPQFYFVSGPLDEGGDWHVGLSVNSPAGLSKRWPDGVEALYAKEFTLKVIELNPTVSYRILDNLAIAGGVRFVYSEGVVKTAPNAALHGSSMDLTGSSWDIGWNAALSYKPFDAWGMAATYRSNVDMTEDGGQKFDAGPPYGVITTPASVSLPLPAVLSIATDVSLTESTNLEFVYERAFWSSYNELNIKVPAAGPLPGMPAAKDWEDSNTFRLGLTQGLGDSVDLMIGLAYDQTPVPDETISFELPDSDAYIGSLGFRWAVNEEMDIGAAILYDQKQDRDVTFADTQRIEGTFSNSSAVLVSFGLGYKF